MNLTSLRISYKWNNKQFFIGVAPWSSVSSDSPAAWYSHILPDDEMPYGACRMTDGLEISCLWRLPADCPQPKGKPRRTLWLHLSPSDLSPRDLYFHVDFYYDGWCGARGHSCMRALLLHPDSEAKTGAEEGWPSNPFSGVILVTSEQAVQTDRPAFLPSFHRHLTRTFDPWRSEQREV